MRLAQELFVAENVTDLETVVYALKRNIPMPRLYCILFISEKNCYEIVSSWELCRGRFQSKNGVVVGVANGKREAFDLIAYMIEEVIKDGKDLSNPSTWIEGVANEVRV
ncbi:hypothetical protein [Anaerotignum sp. MB30-C6]|uniref:hypothetical protein n=1 Tax=Anaerotignum sp. MB30-C6 TaxID=3070814 RepID=UPI0027DB2CA2|nr:hypothetical protein [Anaerotignum sp. MB30-C6]WMI81346.1 hypothetical protein RBQ60_01040 [Anaerotignum sp. MB30-C6]